jgi:hypothetical protein
LAIETWVAAVAAAAAVVATKTTAATGMAGAQTTINNQLKVAAVTASGMATAMEMAKEMATETATMRITTMTMPTMAMAAAVVMGGSGNEKAGLPPSSLTDLHWGAAPCVDNFSTLCVQ